MKETKAQRGITLIALVITIIVMLILVGVTISMAVNGGLFYYAEEAVGQTKNALNVEEQLANGRIEIGGEWYDSIDQYLNKDKGNNDKEPISKTESFVGCYADIDGDGEVDGIIYADLANATKTASWGDYEESGTYTITQKTGLKDYYVSKTEHVGTFGTEPRDVIAAKGGNGNDRFYVMALSDVSTSTHTWYKSKAKTGISVTPKNPTSEDFGKGKENTINMINLWNQDTDLSKDSNDVWGVIQNSNEYEIVKTVNDSGKWFVPSREELAAFFGEVGITYENCDSYNIYELATSSLSADGKEVYDSTIGFGDFIVAWPFIQEIGGGFQQHSFRLSATF